jgi:hypothetical protein
MRLTRHSPWGPCQRQWGSRCVMPAPPHRGRWQHRVGLMGQRTRQPVINTSSKKALDSTHVQGSCQHSGGKCHKHNPSGQAPPTQPWEGGQRYKGPPAGEKQLASEADTKTRHSAQEGNTHPSTRAGANPNLGLTLALASAKSPNTSRGGTARPALHPRGRGECPRAPAIKL